MMKIECPLCEVAQGKNIITRVYYNDEEWVMLDCKVCFVPMLIYKHHVLEIEEVDKDMAYNLFFKYAQRANPAEWYVDYNIKTVKNHWHCHLRRK